MHKLKLSRLNRVEIESLRILATSGKLPRILTLAKFVQLGILYPGTYGLKPGVREDLEAQLARNTRLILRRLNGDEIARALYARKQPPIL